MTGSSGRFALLRLLAAVAVCSCLSAQAQIDPYKRELIQFGYNLPTQGRAPLSAYAFYYINIPDFLRTNVTFRLAVAPVYMDSEIGLSRAFGKNTDLGIGVEGGGFADSYAEIREGKYLRRESFTGHGGGTSMSVYHRFNPEQRIPLSGVFRTEMHYSVYERDDDTDDEFVLPPDRGNFNLRTGLRWGGREPLMIPKFGLEVSAWYEAQLRTDAARYGFDKDRDVNSVSHLFWIRTLLAYTIPKLDHTFNVGLTFGGSGAADRFSAYRLGGLLPLAEEFPLSLPGYYFQEFSARRYVLLGGIYTIPLDSAKRWSLAGTAATAGVDYEPGLEQPGRWHSGVGGGISYRSKNDAWQVVLGYAYGVDAIRENRRGAHSIGLLLQLDLDRAEVPMFEPGQQPLRSRGLQRLFRNLNPF
jgi:hypothetical protein